LFSLFSPIGKEIEARFFGLRLLFTLRNANAIDLVLRPQKQAAHMPGRAPMNRKTNRAAGRRGRRHAI
jgi:hypothetical protein